MLRGQAQKLQTTLNAPVDYHLSLGRERVHLNPLLGQKIHLNFHHKIHCIHCAKVTSKSFNQGYCYPCFRKLAACDLCIMKPELCHYAQGTCREPEWAAQHCMQPHIVYLANTTALKVGITRLSQVPTRWMDQGAEQALPIFSVQTRYQSGVMESLLKKYVSDRTNWRLMLQGPAEPIDLQQERDRLFALAGQEIAESLKKFTEITPLVDSKVQSIGYPVLEYPKKINSHDLEKKPALEGTLLGIKGQYLILDSAVINIRKYTGFELELRGF